uniref:Uncharacterized protein n=1 Tax=Leersia perrieri TaxID=77586 RepID=A0A0D9XN14_9ORYZ
MHSVDIDNNSRGWRVEATRARGEGGGGGLYRKRPELQTMSGYNRFVWCRHRRKSLVADPVGIDNWRQAWLRVYALTGVELGDVSPPSWTSNSLLGRPSSPLLLVMGLHGASTLPTVGPCRGALRVVSLENDNRRRGIGHDMPSDVLVLVNGH